MKSRVVVCGFLLAGLTCAATAVSVVARVNGSPISSRELDDELDRLVPANGAHGGMRQVKREEYRKKALDELVVRELAYQRASALKLKVDPAELKAAQDRIRGRYKTEKSFQEALRAEQITEREFSRRIERDLLLRKVHKLEIDDKAAVSESEIREYYEKNKAKFEQPESVRLRQIVVRVAPGKEEAARKKIQEALDKLKAGEKFEAVAYRYSEDDYRVMGGDYGSLHRGRMEPQVEQAAFAAKSGVVTGPFQSQQGWHVIRVDGRTPQRQLKFEEVKEKIAADLRAKKLAARKAEFARSLRAGAKIEYPNR